MFLIHINILSWKMKHCHPKLAIKHWWCKTSPKHCYGFMNGPVWFCEKNIGYFDVQKKYTTTQCTSIAMMPHNYMQLPSCSHTKSDMPPKGWEAPVSLLGPGLLCSDDLVSWWLGWLHRWQWWRYTTSYTN